MHVTCSTPFSTFVWTAHVRKIVELFCSKAHAISVVQLWILKAFGRNNGQEPCFTPLAHCDQLVTTFYTLKFPLAHSVPASCHNNAMCQYHGTPSPIMEAAFSQSDFPKSRRGRQPKRSQPFWVQLPDIHPTKIPFLKDRFLDRIILPPVAIAPGPNMSKPSAKTAIPFA
jgi:hypothetical protein